MMQGGSLGADSSLNKIFWSEMDIAGHEVALEMLGPDAEIDEENRWLRDYMFALAGPIYAGTNEVQRMIVANRVLELPR